MYPAKLNTTPTKKKVDTIMLVKRAIGCGYKYGLVRATRQVQEVVLFSQNHLGRVTMNIITKGA